MVPPSASLQIKIILIPWMNLDPSCKNFLQTVTTLRDYTSWNLTGPKVTKRVDRVDSAAFLNWRHARLFKTSWQWHSRAGMAQSREEQSQQQGSDAPTATSSRPELIICLRDISAGMVKAWQSAFKGKKYENVKVCRRIIYCSLNIVQQTDQ